jgi:hypothetical protein
MKRADIQGLAVGDRIASPKGELARVTRKATLWGAFAWYFAWEDGDQYRGQRREQYLTARSAERWGLTEKARDVLRREDHQRHQCQECQELIWKALDKVEGIDGTLSELLDAARVRASVLAPVLCVECGKRVEEDRRPPEPTCHACLPPPPLPGSH